MCVCLCLCVHVCLCVCKRVHMLTPASLGSSEFISSLELALDTPGGSVACLAARHRCPEGGPALRGGGQEGLLLLLRLCRCLGRTLRQGEVLGNQSIDQ